MRDHLHIGDVAEERRSGDEGIGAGPGDVGDVVGLDTAVDLEPDGLAAGLDALAHALDLAQRRGDEALPAEAGVDRHQQHQVQVLEHVVRSEENTSELQSLMRNSYAIFSLKKKHNII